MDQQERGTHHQVSVVLQALQLPDPLRDLVYRGSTRMRTHTHTLYIQLFLYQLIKYILPSKHYIYPAFGSVFENWQDRIAAGFGIYLC